VTLELVNVVTAETQVNTSEVVLFQVKVSNAGPMHMTQVTVLLEGRNGAQVRAQGSFEDSAESDVYPTIEAHDASGDRGKVLDVPFQLLAPRDPQDEANLVKASLMNWDLTWDHALQGHTDPQQDVKATWGAEVHPRT
jgi:hypothetical protein